MRRTLPLALAACLCAVAGCTAGVGDPVLEPASASATDPKPTVPTGPLSGVLSGRLVPPGLPLPPGPPDPTDPDVLIVGVLDGRLVAIRPADRARHPRFVGCLPGPGLGLAAPAK